MIPVGVAESLLFLNATRFVFSPTYFVAAVANACTSVPATPFTVCVIYPVCPFAFVSLASYDAPVGAFVITQLCPCLSANVNAVPGVTAKLLSGATGPAMALSVVGVIAAPPS